MWEFEGQLEGLSGELKEKTYCECTRHVCGMAPFSGPVCGVSFLVHAAVCFATS